ncbi:MAG: dihydroorotate dehydrogenase electron transfer subunit [Firmicutes bacterium]|nr:dihydroorotate dehydrogenase electron transfer subunit [Bacillota bacterium]
MKKIIYGEILSNDEISTNIFDMKVKAEDISKEAKAGQFAQLFTGKGELILPRPISICEAENGILRFVYMKVGKGTDVFSKMKKGESIKILAPCGNGFYMTDAKEHIIVGGGIGIPPMLELTKRLKGKKTVILGSRSKGILAEEFKKYADEVYIASDDGSEGFKGNVVDLMREKNITGDMIYACGPKIMLKFVSMYADEKNTECQVSMEERMACGIGACVGCVVKIKDSKGEESYKKVCKDGPVFYSSEVVWE